MQESREHGPNLADHSAKACLGTGKPSYEPCITSRKRPPKGFETLPSDG